MDGALQLKGKYSKSSIYRNPFQVAIVLSNCSFHRILCRSNDKGAFATRSRKKVKCFRFRVGGWIRVVAARLVGLFT